MLVNRRVSVEAIEPGLDWPDDLAHLKPILALGCDLPDRYEEVRLVDLVDRVSQPRRGFGVIVDDPGEDDAGFEVERFLVAGEEKVRTRLHVRKWRVDLDLEAEAQECLVQEKLPPGAHMLPLDARTEAAG